MNAVSNAATNTAQAAQAGYQKAKELAVKGLQAAKDGVVKGGASAAEWALDNPYVQKLLKGDGTESPEPRDPYHELDIHRCAVQRCKGDPKAAKAMRRHERKQKIAAARNRAKGLPKQEQEKLLESANRLERYMDAVERANLCHHVYEDAATTPPPLGHSVVSDAELKKIGIEPKLLKSKDGFKARLYKTDKDVFGEEKYILVFKGTEFTNANDWKNNVRQGAGKESAYYNQAMKLAERLKYKKVPFEVAGHSLGGGMAAAAAQVSGNPASTFNAAGLHEATVPRYSKGAPPLGPDQVQAYRVKGEVLTKVQESPLSPLPVAPGRKHDLDPADPKQGAVDRHGMNAVIDSMERQKRHDEAVLGGGY